MNTRQIRQIFALLLLFLFAVLSGLPNVDAQTQEVDDMKVIQQVAELQQKLKAEEIATREEAEKKLIEIGVSALDHLEPVNDDDSADYSERLSRVRIKLESIAVASVTQPKPIQVKQEMKLRDLLKAIKAQSGNQVELLAGPESPLMDKAIKFDFEKGPFWKIIHALGDQASLSTNAFQSDRGVLRLVPLEGPGPSKKPPRDSSGVFDATVTQVSASKNLLEPKLNHCTLQLRLRWEPRISPIAISLPAKSIRIKDEFDREIKVPDLKAVYSGTVSADTPELQLNIGLSAIDRQVETLKSFDCQLNTILPGRVESFKFRDIGRQEAGVSQSKAGVRVGFEGVQKNEDLYAVLVSIGFDNPSQGLESHLNWVYENQMYMTGDDEKKHLPLATETAGRTKEKITIKYFYAEDPSAWTLHYRTPAAIVSVPIKISLKGIPLP